MKFKLPNEVYDFLKYVAIIALPAIASFYADIAPLWGLPYEQAIPKTIAHIATLLGALLVVSTHNYNKEQGEE